MTIIPGVETDWTVELQFKDQNEPLRVHIEQQILVGRAGPDGAFTGIDLTPYQAEALGVSRRHAQFQVQQAQMTVTDLGSDNGTFHNGTLLKPNLPYPINTGDRLAFGNLECWVTINDDLGKTAIVSSRSTFEMQAVNFKAKGEKVLIVEDDVSVTKLYEVMLQREGYTTEVCYDVVSAIRQITAKAPEVVILDLRLAGVHGLELCRYIRRDANHPNLPIVVVSALYTADVVKEALEAGADVFLSKPVNYRELLSVIGSLVYQSQQGNVVLGTKQLSVNEVAKLLVPPSPREDTLMMYIEGRREPLTVVVQQVITLGRHNPMDTSGNHVNLDAFGAFEKGVSRVHARIRRMGKGFQIADNESTNGTFLNGQKLVADQWFNLKNGDEILFGTLKTNLFVVDH